MQMPDAKNTIKDEKNDITYEVMAYRKLNRSELVQAVRIYHSLQKRRAKLKRVMNVTIATTIGG